MSWRIRDWNLHFENNRTRDLKRMDWVPIPNRMDGDGYTELLEDPAGTLHFAAWIALVQIASRCEIRGTLLRKNHSPHDASSLSRLSRIPEHIFNEAFPRLVKIGWLEDFKYIEIKESQVGAVEPQEGALETTTKPHDGVILTGAGGRFPSVPFRSIPEGGAGEESEFFTPAEFESAWERHLAHSPKEAKEVVLKLVMSMNGKFDIAKFRARHEPYCEHWRRIGWTKFGVLTFWAWIEAGMPEAPPEPETVYERKQRQRSER